MINQEKHTTGLASWIAIATHPHRESLAIENLLRQDYNVYCPMIVKRIRHARRAYDAKRPLFPGYIFVEHKAGRHRWRPILSTYGVRSVVLNGEVPAILPAGLIEGFRSREVGGVILKPEEPFKPGQAVTISGGPFDGLAGQIIEVRESDRILLLLDLLHQQAKVHVEATMLRMA